PDELDDCLPCPAGQEDRAEAGLLRSQVERRRFRVGPLVVGGRLVVVVGHAWVLLSSVPVNFAAVEPPSAKRDMVRGPSGSRVGRLVEIKVGSWFCQRASMSWAIASTVHGYSCVAPRSPRASSGASAQVRSFSRSTGRTAAGLNSKSETR